MKFLQRFDRDAIAVASQDPSILFLIIDNPRGSSSFRGHNIFNPVEAWHLVCGVKNPTNEDCPQLAPPFIARLDENHTTFIKLSRGGEQHVPLNREGRATAASMNLLIYKHALAGSETYGKLMINLCGGQTNVSSTVELTHEISNSYGQERTHVQTWYSSNCVNVLSSRFNVSCTRAPLCTQNCGTSHAAKMVAEAKRLGAACTPRSGVFPPVREGCATST